MNRHQQVLTGVLIVQVVLSVLLWWPRGTGGEPAAQVFPDITVDDVEEFSITDDAGSTVSIRRVGDAWALPDAGDFPVLADRAASFLEKLLGLTTARMVTRTSASHPQLGVAYNEFVRRIEFSTSAGAQHTVYLGSSPSYGATHFRVDGQDETYLTSDLTTWEVNGTAASWVDTTYLSLPAEDVARISLENSQGSFQLVKDDDGSWTLSGLTGGEELNSNEVNAVVNATLSVFLQEPLGRAEKPEYGMSEPAAVVTLEVNGQPVSLYVGAKSDADAGYVVKSSQSEYYVEVASYAVEPLVDSARDSFVLPPATPTPDA
ncbi:MAG: DUF4340 domain-containing protein [Chloroflexi bacterium]|nr:DUF4340 domain-containing protein [Chloroflexota bacterium]